MEEGRGNRERVNYLKKEDLLIKDEIKKMRERKRKSINEGLNDSFIFVSLFVVILRGWCRRCVDGCRHGYTRLNRG